MNYDQKGHDEQWGAPMFGRLASVVARGDLLAMFAEALAMVLRHLWRTLPALAQIFAEIRRHPGLRPQAQEVQGASFSGPRGTHGASFCRLWAEAAPAPSARCGQGIRAARALGLGAALSSLAQLALWHMQVTVRRGT